MQKDSALDLNIMEMSGGDQDKKNDFNSKDFLHYSSPQAGTA